MSQIILAVMPSMTRSVIVPTLESLLLSNLEIFAVTAACHHRVVVDVLAERDVADAGAREHSIGACLGLGVTMRPHARGWLLLPADAGPVPAALLATMSLALQTHPLVHAMSKGRRSYPVGVSADLYSEMSRVDSEERFRRLLARYPAQAFKVEDIEHGDYTLSVHGTLR